MTKMSRFVTKLSLGIASAFALAGSVLVVEACSSNISSVGIIEDPDAGTDGSSQPKPDSSVVPDDASTNGDVVIGPEAGGRDASCATGVTKPATGETCIGFGKKSPCDPACGLPEYGYVCFNGGPPGFAGCLQTQASAFGETYCCPSNACVPQPDQDGMCAAVAGKPHRYQCPPKGPDAGNVDPPAGCVESGSGASEVEKFYCCP